MKKQQFPFRIKLLAYFQKRKALALVVMGLLYISQPASWDKVKHMQALKGKLKEVEGEITATWTEREETEEDWPIYGYEYIYFSPEIGQFKGEGFSSAVQRMKKQ